MMALATEAASGQVTDTQRSQDIETEYQLLSQEINSIASSTTYAGTTLLTFPNTTAGAFSWASNSVLAGFYEAQVLRNTQYGAANNGEVAIAGIGDVSDTGQVGKYTSGADGLPAGTSGTFNATPYEGDNGSPFGPVTFLVGTNASATISVSLDPINTITLNMERDVVSYSDSPQTTAVGLVTNPLPPHNQISGVVSAATWLAQNPTGNLPGEVSTSIDSTFSNVSTVSAALATMGTLSVALQTVTTERANIAGYESQLRYAGDNIATSLQAVDASASVMMDVDVAGVKARLSSDEVKSNAAVAALTQAAQLPHDLLKLIQS